MIKRFSYSVTRASPSLTVMLISAKTKKRQREKGLPWQRWLTNGYMRLIYIAVVISSLVSSRQHSVALFLFLSFFARNLSRLGRKFLSRLFNDSMHSKDRWNVQFVYISARIGLTSIASVEPSEETFQKMYIICFVFSFSLSVRADWCRCRYWIRFRTKTKQSGTRLILGNYVSLPLSVRNAFDWVSWNTLVP